MNAVSLLARSFWSTSAVILVLFGAAVAGGLAFKLTLAGSIALYFVVWWTLLFAILPIRIQTQSEAGEVTAGTDPSAPASPALYERAIWTTIVSTAVFIAVAAFFPLAGI